MSNIDLIIEERASDIGNFLVGRLLPFRKKRMVGPFIFIDHMGPAHLPPGEKLNVGPHPHIGLSTLTYLLEGVIRHRDSLGTDIEIRPGAVNLMKAGKGIVHSERTPPSHIAEDKIVHGLQIWLALPKEIENSTPEFTHVEAKDIPVLKEEHLSIRCVLGEFGGMKSPVPMHSPSYMLELKADEDVEVNIGDELFGESGLYVIEGSVETDGHVFGEKQLLIAKESTLCSFTLKKNSMAFIFGGDKFQEERFIYWNFVSSDKETLESAKTKWKNHQFPDIEGETDRVPLPAEKR